jgi:hypothetical protein
MLAVRARDDLKSVRDHPKLVEAEAAGEVVAYPAKVRDGSPSKEASALDG